MDGSDLDLLRRIASGDAEALAALYDRHAPRVLGLLVRLVPDRGEAEDILQVTFCEAWSKADRYDPARSSPLSWLLLIARSRALDHARRRARAVPVGDGPEPVTADDVGRDLERGEASRAVHAALDRLAAEQREAVLLAFFAGRTHEQIAQQLRLPLGTVKSRIRLGMQRLRDLLGDRDEQ